jgi:hypothetical protein
MKIKALSFRFPLVALALALMAENAVLAQAGTDNEASEPGTITVTGNREKQAAAAANQAKAITPKPAGDVPLPRHFAPLCVMTFGIDPNYGAVLAERVTANTKALGLPVGGQGCSPNVWIGFVRNSKDQVKRLRETNPEMFRDMKQFEIDRIFKGSGAVQVWHSTEQRSYDGKPLATMTINGREVKTNPQYQAGRTVSPIRTDINGSLVIFDLDRANGLTVQQLADYATMRILVPVLDIAEVEPGSTVPSILALFAKGADPRPDGLTEFDWAYLSGFYRLDRGARAAAVHDATEKAMLDGTATALSQQADGS